MRLLYAACCALLLVTAATATDLSVEAALYTPGSNTPVFTRRAGIIVAPRSSGGGFTVSFGPDGPGSAPAAEPGTIYTVRLPLPGGGHVSSSVPACSLAAVGWQHAIVVRLDRSGEVRGVTLVVKGGGAAPCSGAPPLPAGALPATVSLAPAEVEGVAIPAIVGAGAPLPGQPLVTQGDVLGAAAAAGMSKEESAKLLETARKQAGVGDEAAQGGPPPITNPVGYVVFHLQKYWYLVLPALIVLMLVPPADGKAPEAQAAAA